MYIDLYVFEELSFIQSFFKCDLFTIKLKRLKEIDARFEMTKRGENWAKIEPKTNWIEQRGEKAWEYNMI